MKAYEPLQEAFRRCNTSTIEWINKTGFPRSHTVVNGILYHNRPVETTCLILFAFHLGLSVNEIIKVLDLYAKDLPQRAKEVAVFKALIKPTEFAASEIETMTKLRTLDKGKQKLVHDMVKSL